MRKEDVFKLPSMPAAGPSYPAGPYRFIDREFLVITYETDPDLIRAALPEPLEPIEKPIVHYEWIKMPDSSGFGSYTESGLVIPARLHGEDVNFVSQMYLDDDPPIAAGPRDLGFSEEIRPSQARDRQGHADRHAGICRTARRHGHHGLQARKHGRQRRRHPRHVVEDADQSEADPGRRRPPGDLPAGRDQPDRHRREGLVDRARAGCIWCRTSTRRSPTFRSAGSSAPITSSPT